MSDFIGGVLMGVIACVGWCLVLLQVVPEENERLLRDAVELQFYKQHCRPLFKEGIEGKDDG